MVTPYDIETMLYKSFRSAAQGDAPLISISGDVYNGDRPLNSSKEDITIKTLSLSGDGFPQEAIVNVNIYVQDIAENECGYVRDGARLSSISTSVVSVVESLSYENTSVIVDNVSEITEEVIKQHYINVRLRIIVYGNIS